MNPILIFAVSVTACALIAVSIACEIALFTRFAETELDRSLAIITGACLVACQFLLVWVLKAQLKNRNNVLAVSLLLLISALFAVSVVGTATWLETRFQSQHQQHKQQHRQQHQARLNNSQQHQQIAQLIADLKGQADLLRQQAKSDNDSGNPWRAGERLKDAAQAEQQRLQALAMLNRIEEHTPSKQVFIFENTRVRWFLWLLLAGLIDLCPLLCFAALKLKHSPKLETPAETPTETLEETATTKTPTQNTVTLSKKRISLEEHRSVLIDEIKAGNYPERISVRAVMKRHRLGYKKAKALIDTLPDSALSVY